MDTIVADEPQKDNQKGNMSDNNPAQENPLFDMLTGADAHKEIEAEKAAQETKLQPVRDFQQSLIDLLLLLGKLREGTIIDLQKRDGKINIASIQQACEAMRDTLEQIKNDPNATLPTGEILNNFITLLTTFSRVAKQSRTGFFGDHADKRNQPELVGSISTYIKDTVLLELESFQLAWNIKLPKSTWKLPDFNKE